MIDTRSAAQLTAGVCGAGTSWKFAPSPADDEDAYDAVACLDFDIVATMLLAAGHIGRLPDAVPATNLGTCRPCGGPAMLSAIVRSNATVAGALFKSTLAIPMPDANDDELPLLPTTAPKTGGSSARRFTSAKCSQMLTLLRGRSHDNRPVDSVDDGGTSGEMNDDMHGW